MDQSSRITRRVALRHLAVITVGGPILAACQTKELTCTDTAGLTPEDVSMRNVTAAYTDKATDPAKKCNACVQYTVGGAGACGGCKVIKGPVHPEGSCKLFVAKTA